MGGILGYFYSQLAVMTLPAGVPHALRLMCRVLFPLAGLLCTVTAAGVWLLPLRPLIAVAVPAGGSLAGWIASVAHAHRYDGDMRHARRALADAGRRLAAQDRLPLA